MPGAASRKAPVPAAASILRMPPLPCLPLARRDDGDHGEDEADGQDAGQPGEDGGDGHQRDRDAHGAEHHLLLVVALLLERPLLRLPAVAEAALDALDEAVDHRRLHLRSQLAAGRDGRLELLPDHGVLVHPRIVRAGAGRRKRGRAQPQPPLDRRRERLRRLQRREVAGARQQLHVTSAKKSPSRSDQAGGNSGSCSGHRTVVGTAIRSRAPARPRRATGDHARAGAVPGDRGGEGARRARTPRPAGRARRRRARTTGPTSASRSAAGRRAPRPGRRRRAPRRASSWWNAWYQNSRCASGREHPLAGARQRRRDDQRAHRSGASRATACATRLPTS